MLSCPLLAQSSCKEKELPIVYSQFFSLIVVEIKHEGRSGFETADKTENLRGLLNRLVGSGRVLGVCHLISY